MKLVAADIVTAFDSFTVGSKVLDLEGFGAVAAAAIEAHDFGKDPIPGQGFIVCLEAIPYVSAGDGLRTKDPGDYLPVLHRDQVGLYLRRSRAGEVKFCALIVYTLEAYLRDPEVEEGEAERVQEEGATHVLVAVIASSGPEAPLSPWRLVCNLAGGNLEAGVWGAEEIKEKATRTRDYWTRYEVVAG